jgi:hypothetical protein
MISALCGADRTGAVGKVWRTHSIASSRIQIVWATGHQMGVIVGPKATSRSIVKWHRHKNETSGRSPQSALRFHSDIGYLGTSAYCRRMTSGGMKSKLRLASAVDNGAIERTYSPFADAALPAWTVPR